MEYCWSNASRFYEFIYAYVGKYGALVNNLGMNIMKYRKILNIIQIVFVSQFFILIGCTVSAPLPGSSLTMEVPKTSNGENALSLFTVTPQVMTHTPLPASVTVTKQAMSLSVTPTMTPTTQPTADNEQASIPTPPGKGLKEQVLWLYETNNGCQLPCWWGIVPGQTDWQTAKELLSRFDQDIYRNTLPSGEIYYGVNIPLPLEVFSEDRTELGVLVRDGIVVAIQTSVSIGDTPPDHLSQYMLSTVLTTHGQPAEVWLSTSFAPFEHNELPFDMLLFYPEKGIMALYNDNGIKEGDIVRGCPQQDPARVFTLWSPTLGWTFEKVKNDSSAYNVAYLPLEETTELSISEFYETFKNPDNLTCLETEAELWRYTQ